MNLQVQFIKVVQTGGDTPGVVQYPPRNVDFYLTNIPKDSCVNYLISVEEAEDIVSLINTDLNLIPSGNKSGLIIRAKDEGVNLTGNNLYFVLEF